MTHEIMPLARRFLLATVEDEEAAAPPPEPVTVDSDIVVILAALLCALICVVGLALVARCAWLRRSPSSASGTPPAPLPNKGLKKKVLRSLPKLSFHQAISSEGKLSAECPICLAEFADGDEIRVLPQCGHGFHVACVDIWLGSHSSCPSCRQILVAASDAGAGAAAAGGASGTSGCASTSRCRRCGASAGEVPVSSAEATTAAMEVGAKVREDSDAGRFLP